MNQIAALLLIGCAVSAPGQTNSEPCVIELFSLPCPGLRAPAAGSEDSALQTVTNEFVDQKQALPWKLDKEAVLQDNGLLSPTNSTSEVVTLDREQALMLRLHERLNEGGYLALRTPPPDNLYGRTMNAIFKPEPVRVGKTTVAFSPLTAIKRKNPLALLNPIVLHISW